MKSTTEAQSDDRSFSVARVTRAVVVSQALFTAGNSLTTGGFFYYFINDFQPSAFLFALLQIAPESSEALSFFSRWLIAKLHYRKRLWIIGLILGRLVALLIPLALMWSKSAEPDLPVIFILFCTIVWYLCQGTAYLSLISWLSDLVPERNWGHFFARRKMAHLVIALSVPIAAGLLRKQYLYGLSSQTAHWSYAIIFLIGGILCLSSIIPMRTLPDVPWRTTEESGRGTVGSLLAVDRNLHYLLASRWWLAFFQGFSQVVLFQFSVNVLKVSLETYYIFSAIMYSMQIPCSWIAGKWSDQSRDRNCLALGMVLVSFGMLFFVLASPERQWVLVGTYLMWGAFGLVNVCGENLCLKLSPQSDNAAQFSLYRQTSGLIAGGAGLLGGWWLDRLLAVAQPESLMPFYILIGIAFVGRITAPLWLLGVQQPITNR